MATHTWIGSNGGTAPWDVAANWSDDTLPVAGDTEIFDQPFGSTVTFDSQAEALNNGTIDIETGGVGFSVSQTMINGVMTTTLPGALSNDGLVLVGSNAAFVIRAGSMSNNGTIALTDTGAQLVSYAAANANQGMISIGQNDAFTVYGGDFSNTGVVEARAGSTITITGVGIGSLATVTNTGTILMNNSTLFLNGVADVAQTVNSTTGSENSLLLGDLGSFGAIALNGTVQVGSVFNRVEVSEASIGSGTIAFDGSGTLALDTFRTINSQGSISATIEGFDTNDVFDLTQISAPSLFVTYTTGTLGIWDALGLVGTLDLVGSYTASEFQFKPDGNGGTDIVFNAPPSNPKADILFQNTSGPLAVWQMSGTTIVGSGIVPVNPGPAWSAVGTGDFFNDGNTDIVFQNDDGSVALWDMNGTNVVGAGIVAVNPGTAWNVFDDNMRFIYSASANETLAATRAAPDEFVFTSFAAGSHTIGGFNPVQDMIEFSKAQFASFTDVQAATSAVSDGAMINLRNGSSLLLPGVDAGSLHTSNFALA
jgi:hypothetical protein